MRFLLTVCLMGLLVVPVMGQQRRGTISTASQAFAQQAQALRDLEYSVQRLAARFDAIEQQQAQLAARIAGLEQNKNAASRDDLAAVRADLNAVKSSQERLRGEIVEDLSKKISALSKQREESERKAREKAAAQKSGYKHTVEAGQTISAIADAYGVTTRSIIKANKISDPTRIRVGQVLLIPDP